MCTELEKAIKFLDIFVITTIEYHNITAIVRTIMNIVHCSFVHLFIVIAKYYPISINVYI